MLPPGTIFSSLFRLAVFGYLWIIPSPLFKFIIPPLFLLHLLTFSSLTKSGQNSAEVPDYLNTVVLSLPTTSSRLRKANAILNSLLLLCALEFTLTPFFDTANDVVFTRVGAIYPDAAKVVVRYPHDGNDTFRVVFRQAAENNTSIWKDGPTLSLQEKNDWLETVTISDLWPATRYEYALASTSNHTLLSYPETPIPFNTFPDSRLAVGTHFRFLSTSCLTPNFPYVPFQSRVIRGFDLLHDYLYGPQSLNSTSPAVEFMLFLGDFIYADVPAYIGDTASAYRRLYRRNYNSKSFRKIYERLPFFHIYDDHEILNNYIGGGNDTDPFTSAANAFGLYHADANYKPAKQNEYYYNFQYGDVGFFVMDTRRYRAINTEDPAASTMLGSEQLIALQDWLSEVNSTITFKFIISSVPFTTLWSSDSSDSWSGYPVEKYALLKSIQSVPNVIILSGDRHEFAAIEFNGGSHPVLEFSTSPLNMFYIPFIRTLKKETKATVNSTSSDELVPQERVIKAIAKGNVKWSAFEVDTRDRSRPVVYVDVVIDGKHAYRHEIVGTPVKLRQTTAAVGALLSSGLKDMLDRIGFQPSKWF